MREKREEKRRGRREKVVVVVVVVVMDIRVWGSVHQPVTVTRPDSGTALPHTLLETIVDYALNS